MAKLYIGTSGYKYRDWESEYYPDWLKENQILNYYSKDFNTVELNFTYYSPPNPYMFRHMLEKVGKGFMFSLKAHSSVTHSRNYCQKDIERYFDALKYIKQCGQLGSVLLQFPWSFECNKKNIEYLKNVGKEFASYSPAVEFRNSSWVKRDILKILSDAGISFCNVDEPGLRGLLGPTAINTNSSGYIRFHGRNHANWWNPEQSYQRYDYLYSSKELMEWLPRIKKIMDNTDRIFIYFNNHYKAKAVKSAKKLLTLLKDNRIITSQN